MNASSIKTTLSFKLKIIIIFDFIIKNQLLKILFLFIKKF